MTEVKAYVRYLRMSPRKVRLAADLIRGMDIDPALAQLSFMSKAAATPVKKLLESAIANATHNFKLARPSLYVKTVFVGQGPTLKRWRPRAMGSAAPILKRSSHVTLILGSHDDAAAKKADEKPEAKAEEKKAVKKPAAKKAPTKKAEKK